MRVQKNIALLSVAITILSFVGAIILNKNSIVFWCDILIGFFSGSLFSFAVAIISYHGEKGRVLKDIYFGCIDYQTSFSLILFYNGTAPIDKVRENIKAIIECFNTKVHYSFSRINLFCRRSVLWKSLETAWDCARKSYLLLVDDYDFINEYYIKHITDEEMKNYKFKCTSDECAEYMKQLNTAIGQLENCIYKEKEAKKNAD